MVDSSKYLRDLTKNEINELSLKYFIHMKRAKAGFLERPVKERLLRKTRWSEYTQDSDVYDFFYKIREHARTGIGDLLLLCDTLTETQLKEIFITQPTKEQLDPIKYNTDVKVHDRMWQSIPTLENVLRTILKDRETYDIQNKKVWEKKELIEQSDAWKFFFAQSIVRICLEFFKNNSFITTKAHERLVEEVIDMLDSESKHTYVPRFYRKTVWY